MIVTTSFRVIGSSSSAAIDTITLPHDRIVVDGDIFDYCGKKVEMRGTDSRADAIRLLNGR
jgi:hypothetical protein